MKIMRYTLLLIVIMFFTGCAVQKYSWNNYDNVLYQHYKDPTQSEIYIEQLKNIVQEAELSDNVPPGIYAEYGYTFFERGQYNDAKIYFQKEYDKWPESRVFMTKIIKTTDGNIEKSIQKQSGIEPVK